MISARWLSLIVFIVLVALIVKYDKRKFKEKIQQYLMMFSEGMIGGLLVDLVGINAGYYYFPRQPLFSMEYWLIVIPCWGVFGLALNYIWRVVAKDRFIKGSLITLPTLIAWYEGTNLYTHSWVYTVPFYWVILGWIPLMYVFSGCDHRRDVVYKMDYWSSTTKIKSLSSGITVIRYILTIVMFPLLVTSSYKLIKDYVFIKRENISLSDYTSSIFTLMWRRA